MCVDPQKRWSAMNSKPRITFSGRCNLSIAVYSWYSCPATHDDLSTLVYLTGKLVMVSSIACMTCLRRDGVVA